MKKFFTGSLFAIILIALSVALGLSVYGFYLIGHLPEQTHEASPNIVPPGERGMVGASIPTAVARFETSLQSKVAAADSSMTLGSDPLFDAIGTHLSGFACFTIDEGNTNVEDVCGTASGTAITSLTRGISPLTGTSSVASLAFEHHKGASVKITDSPQIIVTSRILNGNETIPNRISYDSTISTSTFSTYNLVNKQYVDGVSLQGAPTATGTTPGVVQVASLTQLSNGTAANGQYQLVPPNSAFTYSPQNATSVPVSNTSGKIAQGWLDLTIPWTFTSTTTLSATTSIAASSSNKLILNTIKYVFPTSIGVASSTLTNDGTGALSWQPTTYVTGFGSWTVATTGSNATSSKDGFITVYCNGGSSNSSASIETPVGITRIRSGISEDLGISSPVRKNDTYLISVAPGSGATCTAYFLPIQ